MRRGQILGLPLVYVFAIIVGALIMLYGITVLRDLMKEADYVDFLDSLNGLKKTIDVYQSYDAGSSKLYTLSFPSKVEYVCFYDPSISVNCKKDKEMCTKELDDMFSVIQDKNYNVYVFPQGTFDQNRFSITSFHTQNGNPICISNGQKLRIVTEEDGVAVAFS